MVAWCDISQHFFPFAKPGIGMASTWCTRPAGHTLDSRDLHEAPGWGHQLIQDEVHLLWAEKMILSRFFAKFEGCRNLDRKGFSPTLARLNSCRFLGCPDNFPDLTQAGIAYSYTHLEILWDLWLLLKEQVETVAIVAEFHHVCQLWLCLDWETLLTVTHTWVAFCFCFLDVQRSAIHGAVLEQNFLRCTAKCFTWSCPKQNLEDVTGPECSSVGSFGQTTVSPPNIAVSQAALILSRLPGKRGMLQIPSARQCLLPGPRKKTFYRGARLLEHHFPHLQDQTFLTMLAFAKH